MATKLGIEKQQDWYNFSSQKVGKLGCRWLLKAHKFSLCDVLDSVYPEFNWNPLPFVKSPHKFVDPNSHVKFFDLLSEHLGIEKQEDWYGCKKEEIEVFGGGLLKQHYNSSPFQALQNVYPQFNWNPCRFHVKTRRSRFDWIGEQLGIEKQEDWYSASLQEVKELGAELLLRTEFEDSLFSALQSIYPEYQWNPLPFDSAPDHHFMDKKNQRQVLDRIAEELGIETQRDWYSVTEAQISAVSDNYRGSLYNTFCAVYPEFEWNLHLLPQVTAYRRKRRRRTNQRELLDRIASNLQIERQEDWYRVSKRQLAAMQQDALLFYYGSLYSAARSNYPEYEWMPWRFAVLPVKFWDNVENQKKCLEWIGERLGIQTMEDWVKVSRQAVMQAGGRRLLGFHQKSLLKTLETVYPEFNWKSAMTTSQPQQMAFNLLKSIFGDEVLSNFRFSGPEGSVVELDLYVPSYSLAFEYQGVIHYDRRFYQGSLDERKERDEKKRQLCKEKGISLVHIPYWWDGSLKNLLAVIYRAQPDIQSRLVSFVGSLDDSSHSSKLLSSSTSQF